MRKTTALVRFAKYAPIGGITNAATKILDGAWTLQHAARQISVTRECVRQDMVALLGAAQYKKLIAARKARVKESRAPHTLSTARAIQFLSHTQEPPLGSAPRFLKHIIERSLSRGLRLSLRVCAGKRPVLLTPGGRPISVRVVCPDGTTRENAIGLHRFNIISAQTKTPPIAIFLLATPAETYAYVFHTKDIAHLKSLVLRYQALDRKSKYSKALNDWQAIAGS